MRSWILGSIALCVSAFALSAAAAADTMRMAGPMAGPAKLSAADKAAIASAMSAAPEAVAKNATIVNMGANGMLVTLRAGTNGFTCLPDDPSTPGVDPMCADANAMIWLNAWMAHKSPSEGKVGFIYMLMGGSDASNTDPFAVRPPAGTHWIKTGPHVMVVGASPEFYAAYPKGPEPDTTVPFVMWAGTPYQHLMAPVK
jgi:hypothetical protein